MAKTRLVKNNKGEYGVYDPYTDQVTPVTGMTLVKNTRGKYGFRSGNEVIPLDEVPTKINLEETFKKKVDTASSSATSSTDSTSEFKSAALPEPVEAESPKKKLEAKQAEKQAENQRYIDMFGLGKLDYSGLQKYGTLGEITADVLDVPANLSKAFVRGVSNGRVSQAIHDYAKDGEAMDSDLIARLVKENATKTGSTYLKALQEKGVLQTDDLSVAGGIAEVIMESLGGMAGAVKAGFQGAALGAGAGLATGAAAGAVGGPIGSAVAGAVSAAGGAMSGFAGATSYVNEYGSTIQESLANKGYDLTDAKQVEKGLKDESVMNEARQKAEARGLTVGMIDALTAGVAGKSAKIAVKIAQNSALQAGKQVTKAGAKRIAGAVALGIESTMGAIGEATGQLAAEGKIKSWDAVALESIAELGPALPTAAYAMYKSGQINSDLNQENLKKIDALKKTSEALTEDDTESKKAIENKISNLEKENKNRNKSMTTALQVAPVPATKRVLELTDAITDLEATIQGIKDGSRTDIDAESRKAIYDSLDDMIAEREEIRQEMLQAAKNEEQSNIVPEKPIKPVVFIGENADKVIANNATQISKNKPLEVSSTGTPITFSEKFSDKESAKPATAFKVTQGENNFGTIIQHEVAGEKQFTLAENGKSYPTMDDAKFALQEKLTGERVSEMDRVGIDRVKVEGNLANKEIFVGNKDNNNQLDMESKGAIQRAVRALRSVSNANVYLYSNNDDYAKGLANASGTDVANVNADTNAQVIDADGQNSIHINLEKAGITTISHEVFHGALLGLAKKDPNAFVTMRDSILNRISDNKSLTVTSETGGKRKVSAKEYLDDFQKRYSGPEYTEADRAEEFLSELAGLMSLEDNDVVKDKSLLDSIKLTIKDVLKKFNVEFQSLNELQDTQDMVDFFKAFNRSVKTGETIDLSKVQGVKPAQPVAMKTAEVQPTTPSISNVTFTENKNGTKESDFIPVAKINNDEIYAKTQIKKDGSSETFFYGKSDSGNTYKANKIYYFGDILKRNIEAGFREEKGQKTLDDIQSDYGVSFDDVLNKLKIKIKKGEEVRNFSVTSEEVQMHKVSGKLKYLTGTLFISKIGDVGARSEKVINIGFYVPKLKYTDEITGVSAAQPEPTTSKGGTQAEPKGPKAKQPINDIVSTATDKAVEIKKKEKVTPVGNKKAIKDRFVRLDLINDALDVEPTSPTDLALQYFIRGGKVLRGRTQDAKKNPLTPEPHSLVTLFSKVNRGIYKQDSEEMSGRVQLVESGAPNIEGIAQMLWESQANQQLQFDTSDLRNAVIDVLLGHKSRASMAQAILADKGTLSQQAILDGDQMLASMSEADAAATKYYADKAGVTTEEFLKDPSKYMDEDEMVDGYNDMQTAFDILDEIQDEEAIKQYLEISTPEDLFLDELADEAVKPEKTLEEEKAGLIAEQKDIKKQIADVNKALAKMSGEAQISLVEPTQTKLYPTETLPAMQKKKSLEAKLEQNKEKIAKIESAIDFKERKTIDAFADIMEQKAEEAISPKEETVIPKVEKKSPVATLTKEEIEWAGIKKNDDIAALENKIYYADLALNDKSTGDNQRQQIEKNIDSYRKAIAIKKSENTISESGGNYSFTQIRIAEGVKSNETLYAELQNTEEKLNERYDNLAMQEQYPPKQKSGPFYKAYKAGVDRLLSQISRLKIESEDIASAIELRQKRAEIASKSIIAKSQLSGEQVSPFKKADPTYKYQMSGTEASLQLVDKIRTKYKMQHTAEEMGMVGKGIRATEKAITDNIITKVFSGANAALYKRFANNRANKLIGKPFAMLQDLIATNVRKGLSAQNASAARASAYSVAMIQNLGSTEGFQSARNKLTGGKSVAKNELWQFGKELNEMINHDKAALRRVHSLLDPEAFEGITDPSLPNDKYDLSFAELRLFNVLRDMNDFIHEWHYEHGFLGEGEAADALYEMNKGSYFPRMYNEIENKKFEDLYDALAKLPNAADFTMFKERKDFASVSEKLTLKEDPIYITTKRFGQMMQNQAILQFCDYVSKSKDYKIYTKLDQIPEGALKAGNYRLLPAGKNGAKRYGDLTGKYVPDIVAQQLMGVEFSNQIINLTYQAAKVFDKSFARQVLSKAKTTWNPLTRAGNITMNFVFASLMGIDPITLLKNRVAAKESIDAYDADTRELDANGLLGVSMGRDLQDVDEKDAKEALSAAVEKTTGLQMRKPKVGEAVPQEAPKGKGRILSESVIKAAKELDQALTDSYGRADDVAKVAAFKSLVYDYGKSREEAIQIIGSGMQNYNTVGKAYDYASKSVNRFVKFKADSARILYNTFKDRPLNLMATLGMLLAAQALASKISGEDEEERKIREERPYTNKIELGPVTVSLTMKFGDSEINVARYLAPYSMYDAGYDSNTLKDISTYLPFQYDPNTVIGVNDPLIGPIINLATDKDFRGMPIYDPGVNKYISKTVTDDEKRWNGIAFAARNYASPYYAWAENIAAAATGDKDYYGRSRSMTDAVLNTFIKVQKVDNATLQKTYEGIIRKLDGDVSDAGKTISHKASMVDKAIGDKYEQEGVTQEQIDAFVAKQERSLIKFTAEQQEEIDKKIIEMQRVEQKIIKLQEIAQRKQNKK